MTEPPSLQNGAESPTVDELRHHASIDPHGRARSLGDVVLGGQDGLVNVLGVVLGVAAAADNLRVTLVAGLAAAVAESVSMAAVAYTSRQTESELYRAERLREYRHVQVVPRLERAEIRAIYARKGFDGALLDQVVDTITRQKDVWVDDMMLAEHGLHESGSESPLRAAFVVGTSALVGSLLPLLPFFVFRGSAAIWAALAMGGAVLFAFGFYKARLTVGRPVQSGLVLAVIGLASALAGYGIGVALRIPSP